jgi:hypothetical protein
MTELYGHKHTIRIDTERISSFTFSSTELQHLAVAYDRLEIESARQARLQRRSEKKEMMKAIIQKAKL